MLVTLETKETEVIIRYKEAQQTGMWHILCVRLVGRPFQCPCFLSLSVEPLVLVVKGRCKAGWHCLCPDSQTIHFPLYRIVWVFDISVFFFSSDHTSPIAEELAKFAVQSKWKWIFGSFWAVFWLFFSKQMSQIDLILFPLAKCPLCKSFDRSHHTSATFLKNYPYRGNIQILKNLLLPKISPKSINSNFFLK